MKTFLLSSSGLKNIVFTPGIRESIKQTNFNIDDYFVFILGEKKISMPRILAEFISPRVSHIHHTDPTVDFLKLNPSFLPNIESNDELVTPELIENFKLLCNGYCINIDEEMSRKISMLSILLGNEELFHKMNELFPSEFKEFTAEEIDNYIYHLKSIEDDSKYAHECSIEKEKLIEFISSHFYSIDQEKLFQLSLSNLYLILTNSHLKLNNEDSLLNFINELFQIKNQDENSILKKVHFFELIEISELSQDKRNDFLNSIDSNEMTHQLWENVLNFFTERTSKVSQKRYSTNSQIEGKTIEIEYSIGTEKQFEGILTKLGDGKAMNAFDRGIIDVRASTVINDSSDLQPQNILNFTDDKKIFHSADFPNSWLCFDFKKYRVKPSHYSIRSHGYSGQGNSHPQTWIIEGSNDNVHWTTLDKRTNNKSLDGLGVSNTFEIENNQNNEYYRYLRIKQTGVNTHKSEICNNRLVISSIEFFGSLLCP